MSKIDIDALGLSTRTRNRLKQSGINTIDQLIKLSEEDLFKIRNLGKEGIKEILSVKEHILVDNEEYDPKLLDKSKYKYEPTRMIELLTSMQKPVVISLLFKNKNGVFVLDGSLKEFLLPKGVKGCLERNNIQRISEIIDMKILDIKNMRSMGEQKYSDLVSFLENNTDIVAVEERMKDVFFSIIERVLEGVDELNNTEFVKKYVIKILSNHFIDVEKSEVELSEEEIGKIINELKTGEQISKYYCSTITSAILRNKDGLSKEELRECIVPGLFDENNFNKALVELVENRRIDVFEDKYYECVPTLFEWVDTLSEKNKDMVVMRLNGHTLEECGEKYGITRERVRQITTKLLNNKSMVKEDRYRYWFEKYALSQEAMDDLFGINYQGYEYLKITTKMKNIKSVDILEMQDDLRMTSSIYKKWKKFTLKNKVLIGDRYVDIKRSIIIKELIKEHCKEDTSIDDFYDVYMNFLKESKLDENDKLLFINKRSFESYILDREEKQYLITKIRKKFRYYPIPEYDIRALVKQLNLTEYNNVKMSTLKLFNDNQALMKEYNLLDEYELHNLLKRTESKWNKGKYKLVFNRTPTIIFGEADEEKQTVNFLKKIAPVSKEEFAIRYEEEYGVARNTVLANQCNYIDKYYSDGYYDIELNVLDEKIAKRIKEDLTKDFYFLDDFTKIVKRKYSDIDINGRVIKQLGYKSFSKYVISDKFESAKEYFNQLLLKDNYIDLTTIDSRISYILMFNNVYNELKKNLEIIEFAPKRLVRFDFFQDILCIIDEDELINFVNEVAKKTEKPFFYNYYVLKKNNLVSSIEDGALNEEFYDLLMRNIGNTNCCQFASRVIFTTSDKNLTRIDFLRYLLEEDKKMSLETMINKIKTDYNIIVDHWQIRLAITDTDIYYDLDTEYIYYNKDYYYEDLEEKESLDQKEITDSSLSFEDLINNK